MSTFDDRAGRTWKMLKRNPLSQLLNVDLARLTFAGWVVITSSVSVAFWGIFLIARDGHEIYRWEVLSCWFGGGLIFFAGRAALRWLDYEMYSTTPHQDDSGPES